MRITVPATPLTGRLPQGVDVLFHHVEGRKRTVTLYLMDPYNTVWRLKMTASEAESVADGLAKVAERLREREAKALSQRDRSRRDGRG